MFKVADRVKETTLTQGTGPVLLAGSFGGFQTFAIGIGNGNSTYYTIENNSQFEIGIGTINNGMLYRDTVFSSSNNNELINLAGVSIVFCTYPADMAIFNDDYRLYNTRDPNFHTHPISGVVGLQSALDAKQPSGSYALNSHQHYSSDIIDLALAVSGYASPTTNASLLTTGTLDDARLSNNVVFTDDSRLSDARSPLYHTHDIVDISGLQNILDSKQPSGNYALDNHTHTSSSITDLDSTVSGLIFDINTIDLHNGGVQNAQILQFKDLNYQAVITGPTPPENYNAQRIIIQGQRASGAGEGGDVYLWGGDSYINGGDIKIYAGDADSNESGQGGYINVTAGYGFNYGGNLQLEAGNSNLNGGNVDIRGGGGSSQGFVRITTAGNYPWLFSNEGNLVLPQGKTINWGQNADTLGSPVAGGATDRIRLWDFGGEGSNFNYAIGVEGNHMWFSMDVNDGTGGFKFYSRDNLVLKISDDSKIIFPNNTTIATGTYDNSTGGYGGISLNCVVGYELNWQGGHLKSTYDNGSYTANILCDSPIEFPGVGIANLQIDNSGITFSDGTYLSSANHNHSIGNIDSLQEELNSKQPSGNYALASHSHYISDLVNFASGVSGLLPITNILGGTNINILPSGSTYTISISGQLGVSAEEVDDRVSQLLISGTGIYLDYNDNENTLTINNEPEIIFYPSVDNLPSTGIVDIVYISLDDSRQYNWTGSEYVELGTGASSTYIENHTHISSNITDFNSSVSGLLPVKNIIGSGNINVTSTTGIYTISASGLIKSDTTGITGASVIINVVQISQANYDALGSYDSNTLYVIN